MNSSRLISPRPPSRGVATRLFLAIALAGIAMMPALFGNGMRLARADISGNTYTSPNYGASVSWDDNWFVIEEESRSSFDIVYVTNGLTYLSVYFEPNDYPSTDLVIALMSGEWRSDSQTSDFQVISDSNGQAIRGGDENRSFAAFSYTYTRDDGSLEYLGVYFEARSINGGDLMMSLIAIMPIDFFFTEYQLAGVTLPEATAAQAEPEVVAGEPAPVFADGVWRLAVATAAHGPEFHGIGLARKNGKDWFVAIVDVTNWSDKAQVFSARDVRLSLTGARKPARIAPASTASVGTRLELAELTEDATVSIQPGETSRVALVYSVAADATEPHLTLGKAKVPMADQLALEINDETIPARAIAPETATGTIASSSDGQTMRVKLAGETGTQRIRLLGVEPPAKGECMANEAEKLLDRSVGKQVLVEEDAAITGGSGSLRYVWLINADGTRTLLNQKLIADGFALAAAIPDEARFGLWLLSSESAAEEAQTGLWTGCETAEATATTAKVTPTKVSSTPTPAPKSTATSGVGTATEWHAEINELGSMDFTITGEAVTDMTVDFSVPCTKAGAKYEGSGDVLGIPAEIEADQFRATFPFTWELLATIRGTVQSDTSVVGSVTIPKLAGCTDGEMEFRWTAAPA